MSSRCTWTLMSLLGMSCVAASGCATLNFPWDQEKIAKATVQNPAVQVICLWEQAEGRDPDGLPCRGFAGQILFLANRHAKPVEIEGDVRVYLFDNVGTSEDQSKPLRQFDFDNEAWKLHLTKSTVGPSYSVFIPYVRRGQSNAQCELRIRFTPKAGPTIFSEVSSLPLKGPATVPETTVVSQPSSREARVHSEVQQTLSQALHRSTTIPLAKSDAGALGVAGRNAAPTTQSDADDRLARMEVLMQQMVQERQQPGASGIQQAGYQMPAAAPVEDAPPQRFKLDRTDLE